MRKKIAFVILSLVILILAAWLGHGIESGFGTIEVTRVYFNNARGDRLSGILFRPENATASTPAPAIVTAHGNNGYPSALTSYNVELARRGYVVLAFEMEGHGKSDYVPDALGDGSYGGTDAAGYLLTLDFVDGYQLGATGHSKGTNIALGMAKKYPERVKAILALGYISPSMVSLAFDEQVPHTNVGLNMSRYDECGQDLLHHIYGTEWNYDYLRNRDIAGAIFSEHWGGRDAIDYLNTGLGDWDEGTKRIFYTIENTTHVTTVNGKEALANGLDFFMRSMPAPIPIDSHNQVWGLKFWAGTAEIIAIVMLLISLGNLLLGLKPFKCLSSEGQVLPKLSGERGVGYRAFFILLFTVIPVLTFVPSYVYGENCIKQSAAFPFNPSSFGYLCWTIANAVSMLAVFLLWHFAYGRKHGGNLEVYGVIPSGGPGKLPGYIGKAALYAVCLVVPVFLVLKVVETVFVTEAASWIFCVRTFSLGRLAYFVQYFLPFAVCFLVSNVAFSAILRDDSSSLLKNQLIGVMQGAGGLGVMYILWNIVFFVSGKPSLLYRETPYMMGNAGFMCICFSLIPMFGINAVLSTQMSVKTKRVWAGTLVCALFIVWITFAGQSLALPSTQSAVGAIAG